MNGLNGDLPPSDLNIEQKNESNETSNETSSKEINLNKESSNEEPINSIPTVCLIVNNLVRPFTIPALKKVLSKHGKIIDSKFYLNKVRSKCYVMYENEKIAAESKDYINNLKWPASNPDTLKSDFFNPEELDLLIKKDEEEKIELEKERKANAELVAAKQEERKQQLKEELSKRFNNELLGADLNDSNGLNLSYLNNSKNSLNNPTSSTQINQNEEDNKEREVSPARNPVTNVLLITNLERPFQPSQLQQLLKQYGPIVEEKFWIDKLKSKCYCVYESNDDALKARNSIHGIKWPSKKNAKTLKVDFGKLSDVNEILNIESGELKNKEDKTAEKPNQQKEKENDNELNKEEVKEQQNKDQNHNNLQEKELKEMENDKKAIVPAKNPISKIVFIKNLSRPFTIKQLEELLSQDGIYDKEKFWIDKIKSRCYAVYENEEIASKTRDRLHNLTWPSSNLRKLVADYATEDELQNALNLNNLNKQIKEQPNRELKEIDEHLSRDRRIRHSLNEGSISNEHDDRVIVDHRSNDNLNKRRLEENSIPVKNKREHREENYPDLRHKEKDHHLHRNNSYDQQQRDSPSNILENLFKKTETKPSIYWMPLNETEIKIRDEQRELNKINRQEFFQEKSFRRYEGPLQFNNGRNRSPRDSPYSRHPMSRNYSPRRPERPYMNDKRPPFRQNRPPMQYRRSLERGYPFERRPIDRNRSPIRTPERLNNNGRDRYHESRNHARSPINRRTPDKQEEYNSKRRSPINKVSRSRSVSSNNSSRSVGSSDSEYSSRSRGSRNSKKPHTPRNQSPRRVPVENRQRR